MNKQEVISKLKSAIPKNNIDGYQRGEAAGLNFALLLLAELDEPVRPPEPKPLEPEKPVAPQFVADFYDSIKDDFENKVYELCLQYKHRGDELPQGVAWWFGDSRNKPIETLVMMHKFGYEVQKEKLYTVEIPNPNDSGYSKIYLAKNKGGKVELFTWSGYTSIEFADNWKQEENAQLTEAEIKKDFEWAWQFAKEVEQCNQRL